MTLVLLEVFVDEEKHFVTTVDKTQTDKYLQIFSTAHSSTVLCLASCVSNMSVFIGAISCILVSLKPEGGSGLAVTKFRRVCLTK